MMLHKNLERYLSLLTDQPTQHNSVTYCNSVSKDDKEKILVDSLFVIKDKQKRHTHKKLQFDQEIVCFHCTKSSAALHRIL